MMHWIASMTPHEPPRDKDDEAIIWVLKELP